MGLRFGVSGFRVWCVVFGVAGSRDGIVCARAAQVLLHHQDQRLDQGSGLRVSGLEFRVWSFGFGVSGFGFRVSGFGIRVWSLGFRVDGLGFRV